MPVPNEWVKIDDDAAPTSGDTSGHTAFFEQLAADANAMAIEHLSSNTISFHADRPLLLHGRPHKLEYVIPWVSNGDVSQIRLSCVCDGFDADVKVWGSVLTDSGLSQPYPPPSAVVVAPGASGVIEVVVDIPRQLRLTGEPRPLRLAIISESEENELGKVTISPNVGDDIQLRHVTMPAAPVLDTSKVWLLRWEAGAYDPERLPKDRLLLRQEANDLYVWPTYSGIERVDLDYVGKVAVVAVPVGHLKVYAIEVTEITYDGSLIELGNYAGGMRASSHWFRRPIIAHERLWRTRTRVEHTGGDVDWFRRDLDNVAAPYGDTPVLPMGTHVPYPSYSGDNPYRVMGSCLVGPYLESQDLDDEKEWQITIDVFGLLMVTTSSPNEDVRLREATVLLNLTDPDDGGFRKLGGEVSIQLDAHLQDLAANDAMNVGALWQFWNSPDTSNVRANYQHSASGLFPWLPSHRGGLGGLGLYPFQASITEDFSETGALERLLQVKVKGPAEPDVPGGPRGPFYQGNGRDWIWLPCWCAVVRRSYVR